jgi:hypothetical protein
MKKYLYFLPLVFLFNSVLALPGDTTIVRSHDKVLWDWYGNKDNWVKFPDASTSYHKVLMRYTLGCPTTGCSEWDYSTKIELRHRPGATDSVLRKDPKFKVDGNEVDSVYLSNDTTWSTFYNQTSTVTDSIVNTPYKIHLYQDEGNTKTITDSVSAWKSNYYNYYFDNLGNVTDSVFVASDSLWKLTYHEYYESFEVVENMELGRVITPYAGNYPNTWENSWIFDVTDFVHLLKDSTEIRAFYGGWQNGFTITLDFIFIEGTPVRNVIDIKNVYSSGGGGFQYGNANRTIETWLTEKKLKIAEEAVMAKIRVTHSGHSFGGAENCAEFCPKNYHLNINGQKEFTQLVWRDDCGKNPIYNQGGTWLYNRANWCPGDIAIIREHDLSPFITAGDSIAIDMDMDPYTYSGGAGFHPNYIIESQLVTYGAQNFVNDASVEDIMAPTNDFKYNRTNPVCNNAIVKIKNNGSADLISVDIDYGIKGGEVFTHTWTGTLKFLEEAIVEIPTAGIGFWSGRTSDYFEVSVKNPNGETDEFEFNNTIGTGFDIPPVIKKTLILDVVTNNQGYETSWDLVNDEGIVIYKGQDLGNNKQSRDTLELDPGCYTFTIRDSGCDGLSFFANSDGSGVARLREVGGGVIRTFNPDFGCELSQSFTQNMTLDVPQMETFGDVMVFPNPSNGNFKLDVVLPSVNDIYIDVLDAQGKLIHSKQVANVQADVIPMDYNLPSGMYMVRIQSENENFLRRIVIK